MPSFAGRSALDKLLALRGGAELVALWAQLASIIEILAGIAAAGVATGLAFGGASSMPALADDAQLRAMWWGSNDRAKRTLDVAKLYQGKTPGVTIVGETNLAARVGADASALYARNVLDFLKLVLTKEGGFAVPMDDDIVAACLMTQGGAVKRA